MIKVPIKRKENKELQNKILGHKDYINRSSGN